MKVMLPVLLVLTVAQVWVGVGLQPPPGGSRKASGIFDWSHSGSLDWGEGIPAPDIECESSPPLPSATWTTTCVGTCNEGEGDGITLLGAPSSRGVLALTVSGRTSGPPASLDLTPVWTPEGGSPLTGASFNVLLPASGLHLWGSTGWEALRGVYLTTTGTAANYTVPDVYTVTAGAGSAELVCNGNRGYAATTANGDQHGSAAINITALCELAYPSGLPPYVRVVDAGVGGLGIIRQTSGCNVGTSILLLSQSVPANYTGNLTFYPSGQGQGDVVATRVGSPATSGPFWFPLGFAEAGQYAAALDGTNDWYTLGDRARANTAISAAVLFWGSANTSETMVGRGDGGYSLGWWFYHNHTNIGVYLPGTESASKECYTPNAWNAAAFSYDGTAGAGHTVVRLNANGGARESAGAGGLINEPTTATLYIGSDANNSQKLNGSIARAAIWTGVALTTAQLATVVATLQSRVAAKPVGSEITFTRNAPESCEPSAGKLMTVSPNTPCVESSGAGIWSAAAASATNTYSDDVRQWTLYRATASDAETLADDATIGTHYAYQTYTATVAAWTLQGEFKAGTKNWIHLSPDDGAGYVWFNLSNGTIGTTQAGSTATIHDAGDGWYFCSVTRTMSAGEARPLVALADADGGSIYLGDGTGTVKARRLNLKATAVPGPYVATANLPAVGVDTVASADTTLTNPSKWCVGARVDPVGSWSRSTTEGLFEFGTYGAPNAMGLYLTSGRLHVDIFSGGAYRAWTQTSAGLTGSDSKRIVLCQLAPNSVAIYMDGSVVPTDAGAGAGDGLLTSFGEDLHIGRMNGYPGNWRVSKVCQASTFAACDKVLR